MDYENNEQEFEEMPQFVPSAEEIETETEPESVAADAEFAAEPVIEPMPEFAAEPVTPEPSYAPSDWQPQYIPPKKKKKKGWTAGKVIALALVCALLGGACGIGGIVLLGEKLGWNTPSDPVVWAPSDPIEETGGSQIQVGDRDHTTVDEITVPTGELMTPAQVYKKYVGSTVGITTMTTTNYWGYQTEAAASGSGFVLSKDGYILTNFHVIENSTSVTVTDYSGNQYDAVIVGYDESYDVAVLKIDATDLQPVVLGKSSDMEVGDQVIAIGNPLGELTFSLTGGLISALNREVTMSTGQVMDLIQTDCAINSGNSGGPLFNLYGEVIGITNAKYSSSSSGVSVDNIGFAIPIDDVKSIVTSIMEKGYVSKPYIGVSVTDVSEEAISFGLPQGAAVKTVEPDGPAAAGGLRVNDIITHLNGEKVTGSTDLVRKVGSLTPGETAEFTVYRQGSELTLTITVAEKVSSATTTQPEEPDDYNQGRRPW